MKSNLQHSTQQCKQNNKNSHYRNNSVQAKRGFIRQSQLSVQQLFQQIWQRVQKVWVAINYFLHNITFGLFEQTRFPWLKIGVVAVLAFVLLQKDLHFSIQMNAPFGSESQAENGVSSRGTQQLSLTPSLSLLDAAKASLIAKSLDSGTTESYIKRFGKVAITEQQKYQIPASVKMAIAILESEAGTSSYTKQTNNHFGQAMKADNYATAWENWRAHSELMIANDSPYKVLLRYGTDYKSWAKGLKDLGYSNINNYDELIIELIEKYEMHRMDSMKV